MSKKLDALLEDFGISAAYKRDFEFLSTGCYALNRAISGKFKGGVPLGTIIELFGDPASGKSLLMNHIFKEAQARGGFVWLDDIEHAFIPEFATKVGVDLNRVLFPKDEDGSISPSETVEEHFTRVEGLLDKLEKAGAQDVPIVIALDSLGALSTQHEMEADMGTRDMFKAQLIRKAMRRIQHKVSRTKVLYLASNHSFDVIETGWAKTGKKHESSGGKGLKFHSMVRIALTLHGKIYDDKKQMIGVRTKAHIEKNRIASPFKDAWLEILFETGINKYSFLMDVLKVAEIVEGGGGGWYTVKGRDDKKWKLSDIEEAYEEIIDMVDKNILAVKEVVEKKDDVA